MWIEESSSHSQAAPQGGEGAQSKHLERLKVSSGLLLIIDQFMLANRQLLSALPKVAEGDGDDWVRSNVAAIREAVERYGGVILEASAGEWEVLRDPAESLFIVARVNGGEESELSQARQAALDARGNMAAKNRVFIDTRCAVFVDANILASSQVLADYLELRQAGNDKAARDRIREFGAAVRYGFNRNGDELGVFKLEAGLQYALWPDVVE